LVLVNNKYLLDVKSKIVYYDWNYLGKRGPFPGYIFKISERFEC